jgi:hypothetical protein
MALKDWKLVTKRIEYVHFINTKNHEKQININTLYPNWYCWIYSPEMSEHKFKSKPLALKFAKSYMKTH